MKPNNKIHVAEYLKDLNEKSYQACAYHYCKKEYISPLTCKELAERCEVTTATISNLTTSSKFYLLYKVSAEILDSYYGYFRYEEDRERQNNPEDIIYPRDINYVLMCLTSFYSDEFLSF